MSVGQRLTLLTHAASAQLKQGFDSEYFADHPRLQLSYASFVYNLTSRVAKLSEQIALHTRALIESPEVRLGTFIIDTCVHGRLGLRHVEPWSVNPLFEATAQQHQAAADELRDCYAALRSFYFQEQAGFLQTTTRALQEICQRFNSIYVRFSKLAHERVRLSNCCLSSRRFKIGKLLMPERVSSFLRNDQSQPSGNCNASSRALQDLLVQLASHDSFFELTRQSPIASGRHMQFFSVQNQPYSVIQFTPPITSNPYYTRIPQGLIERGVEFYFSTSKDEILQRIDANPNRAWIVHFHQLEPYYNKVATVSEIRQRMESLIQFLHTLSQRGVQLVWTQHNPLPHDRTHAALDREFILRAAPYMNRFVVLGAHAKKEVAKYAPPEKIEIIHHPSFEGIYGPRQEKGAARERLQLPQNGTIFGMLGEIKPYKGIEFLMQAFDEVRGRRAPSAEPVHFLVAGRSHDQKYIDELKAKAPENFIFHAKFISDADLPSYLAALDYSVFAFRDIWGSSSVVLSLSYGVPAIAPNLGCLSEYVRPNNLGMLYQSGDLVSLIDTMSAAIDSPLRSHFSYMLPLFNRDFHLDLVAEKFQNLYAQLASEAASAANGRSLEFQIAQGVTRV